MPTQKQKRKIAQQQLVKIIQENLGPIITSGQLASIEQIQLTCVDCGDAHATITIEIHHPGKMPGKNKNKTKVKSHVVH